jgi:hypothetical protein
MEGSEAMPILGALHKAAFAVRAAVSWPFRMLGRVRIFLPALALVWAIALASYAFVWIVDPYELRSSRPSEHLADHPYPGDTVPRLTSVAVNGGADLVILGASTAMGYTPAMMRAAFPEARRPVNLAYSCANEHDFGLILPRLERSPSLKRVIISLDATLISTCGTSNSPLDQRYYVASWHDPVPEFSVEALGLARRVAAGGDLDQPAWRMDTPGSVGATVGWPPMTSQPELMAKARRFVALARGRVTAGAPFPCERVTVLRVLTPFIRREAARGVTIDILSPPYSLALYSDWTASLNPFPGPPFATAMALRRCVLQATAGLPNVYFHAFDADPLTANLTLYRNLGHIRDHAVYQAILNHIAARDHLLTPAQWPAFEARLKQEVDAFAP